jgi:hypothetical protein
MHCGISYLAQMPPQCHPDSKKTKGLEAIKPLSP